MPEHTTKNFTKNHFEFSGKTVRAEEFSARTSQ